MTDRDGRFFLTMNVDNVKPFYNSKEVSEVLRLHHMTALRLLREGKIPAFQVGSQWRIPIDV